MRNCIQPQSECTTHTYVWLLLFLHLYFDIAAKMESQSGLAPKGETEFLAP